MRRISTKLAAGDVIEIKYRAWRGCHAEAELVDRWVRAEIIESSSEAKPLARLADGQVTEIRDYMTWRMLARSSPRIAGIAVPDNDRDAIVSHPRAA